MPEMRESERANGVRDRVAGAIDEGTEAVKRTAHDLRDSAGNLAGEVAAAVKDRPYTTLAIAGGLAFAIGALWMLSRRQPQSRLEALLAQMPDVRSQANSLRSLWR